MVYFPGQYHQYLHRASKIPARGTNRKGLSAKSIQTYSTETDASSYASKNKSTSKANTGTNNDKYCNIWDMSGNACEWTTEYYTSSSSSVFYPCVYRGGYYYTAYGKANYYTSYRDGGGTTGSNSTYGLRPPTLCKVALTTGPMNQKKWIKYDVSANSLNTYFSASKTLKEKIFLKFSIAGRP